MVRVTDTSRVFQRASEAVDKGNYDYAVELLLEILKSDPQDLKARITLRQVTKAKSDKGLAGGLKGAIAGLPNLLAAWLASLFGRRESAIIQYEKYLTRNPMSTLALSFLASALARTGRDEAAIVVLEFLRQNKPGRVATLRKLAHMYEERQDIQRAMQRYQMILQHKPHDIEANKQLHDLAASESIHDGWDKGDTFREKIRDRETAERLEQAQHIVRTEKEAVDAVKRVKGDIDANPENPILWAELGDLQRRRDNYAEAIAAYEKALELDPLNQLYLQKLQDAKLSQFDMRIREAKAAAEAAPGDEALKQKVAEIEEEKQRFWLDELKRRVEERPTDTGLRFELGNAYFQQGKVNEATAAFQRVVRDPKYRVDATAMLGKCFALKGLDELAIEQLEKALEGSSLMEESGKDIAYNLGTLYEKVGNYAAAENAYKKIFEIDIGYRDIAEKMEAVYRKRREKKNPSNPEES